MKSARVLGNYVQKLATEQNVTIPELSALMNCSEQQVKSFFKGRFFASFRQLQVLAHKFGIKVSELIQGDESYYNKTVVDCISDGCCLFWLEIVDFFFADFGQSGL